jgi:hypothetical protein
MNTLKSFAAGAKPQTPLRKVTAFPPDPLAESGNRRRNRKRGKEVYRDGRRG